MLSRRDVLLSATASATLAGCAGPPKPGPQQQLTKLLDDLFEEVLAETPEEATALGLDTGARAGAKSKLHSASIASKDRRAASNSAHLARMKAIDRTALSGMAAVNHDAVLYDLKTTERGNKAFAYGNDGASSPYVLCQINGAWQEVPDFLDSQHTIETAADCDAYVARMGEFARLMDEECERVRRDVGLGVIPPDFALKGAIGGMRTLHGPAATSTLVSSLADRAKVKGIAGDWSRAATGVYEGKILPALERQIALLESLQPRVKHEAGVWRLPDGEALYAQCLQAQTTTNLSPAEVHQMGLDTTAELSARAEVLFAKIGMTRGTVGERYAQMYKDKQYLVANTDAAKSGLIEKLNGLVAAMQTRLPSQFATLPKAALEIRRIPPATEQGASTHYTDGSLDGSRPGIYWLNLRDTAESPYWFLPTTTYHEGIPGHHLQLSLQRQADLPMLRKVMGYAAYSEGWALYAEQLVKEMGVYDNDPAGELGYIHDALLRSGRLVTDTGLHALRWSREKAVATLSAIEGDPPSLSAQEIERYAVWPGQACSYMVGKLTILKLREKAKTALGARFDIRKFHDAVLLSGSMPLTVLEAVVDGYIAANR